VDMDKKDIDTKEEGKVLDKEKLAKNVEFLYSRGTGKTTAMLARAIRCSYVDEENTVAVIAHSLFMAEELANGTAMLAEELGYTIKHHEKRRVQLQGGGIIIFETVDEMERLSDFSVKETFVDHGCIDLLLMTQHRGKRSNTKEQIEKAACNLAAEFSIPPCSNPERIRKCEALIEQIVDIAVQTMEERQENKIKECKKKTEEHEKHMDKVLPDTLSEGEVY